VDPLPEAGAYCRESGLWFHIDGAYGAMAARVPGAPEALTGLKDADSVAVDPHKWLYAPLEAGCVLMRDARVLRDTFSYHPPYYHFDEEAINYFDMGLQNSRGFRALKVWLALRQAGLEGYLRMISDDILLAKHFHGLAAQHSEIEALTQSLSICTFRYVPERLRNRAGPEQVEEYLNRLNQELLTRIESSGEAFLSNAMVDGKYALRMCIVNFRTSWSDVEALPEVVVRHGLAAELALRSLGGAP
jgi:glutamate/tyrosine decarboxylase-like PLP-dependent enzyme